MKKILFLYPTGSVIPKRSAEVMGHIFYDAVKDNEIHLIVRTKGEEEFAKYHELQYFDVRRYNSIYFYSILRISHLFNSSFLIRIMFKDLWSYIKCKNIDIVLERHSIFNIGYALCMNKYDVKYITSEKMAYPDIPYYHNSLKEKIRIMFPLPFNLSLIKRIERKSYERADRILSKHIKYEEFLIKDWKINKKKFYNYYAFVESMQNQMGSNKLASEKMIVTYAGSFDELHSTDNLISIIKETFKLNENIIFWLIGDGPDLCNIKKNLGKIGSNVKFFGRLPHNQTLKKIKESNVCIEVIDNERVKRFGADSIKIYEYMACGKIILASDLPGDIQILEKNSAAILINPTLGKETALLLSKIYFEYENYMSYGDNALELVRNKWNNKYTKKVIAECIDFE